jgi:hypothetical protein
MGTTARSITALHPAPFTPEIGLHLDLPAAFEVNCNSIVVAAPDEVGLDEFSPTNIAYLDPS